MKQNVLQTPKNFLTRLGMVNWKRIGILTGLEILFFLGFRMLLLVYGAITTSVLNELEGVRDAFTYLGNFIHQPTGASATEIAFAFEQINLFSGVLGSVVIRVILLSTALLVCICIWYALCKGSAYLIAEGRFTLRLRSLARLLLPYGFITFFAIILGFLFAFGVLIYIQTLVAIIVVLVLLVLFLLFYPLVVVFFSNKKARKRGLFKTYLWYLLFFFGICILFYFAIGVFMYLRPLSLATLLGFIFLCFCLALLKYRLGMLIRKFQDSSLSDGGEK